MGLGPGIRDPGSGKILFKILDTGSKRHRIPDPDPQHCRHAYLKMEERQTGTLKDERQRQDK